MKVRRSITAESTMRANLLQETQANGYHLINLYYYSIQNDMIGWDRMGLIISITLIE